ncbi:MAG: tRNA (adenosine(37)-N6)-threonylcarbamoyltransferase complex dimerization subunit type 1 TsaB [Paracoccaceae bacterium]
MPPDGPLIAFDTSAAHCAVALCDGGAVIAHRLEPMEKGQAERLFPLLEEILRDAGLGWRDLGQIAVGIGPGNFTGVRIAVSAARGLALSLGIPARGITGFEALAYGQPRPCLASIDARGGKTYLQRLDQSENYPPIVADLQELPTELATPGLTILGHEAAYLADNLGGQAALPHHPLAAAIALAAAAKQDTPKAPAPLYLRPADAAPARDSGPPILP